jgi:phospholipase/lecithinase/hemolysin
VGKLGCKISKDKNIKEDAMKIKFIRWFYRLNIAACLFFLLISASAAITLDRIVVFGDSLSDNGNIYAITKNLHSVIPQIPIIPKEEYYYQGRFSNGPIWIDDLAQTLHVPLSNYAYAGSWAEPLLDSKLNIPFGLGMQVSYYLVQTAIDIHRKDHLFVIWTGGNDYVQGRSDPEYATTNTIKNIHEQIDWLIFAGARKFLVLNIPDLGMVPQVMAEGPDFAGRLSKMSSMHNRKFIDMIESEKEMHPSVTFLTLDINYHFNDIITHPTKYHLTNVKQPCYTGGYWFKSLINSKTLLITKREGSIDIDNVPSLRTAYLTALSAAAGEEACPNPDEYAFWDQLHPTRVVHQLLALLAQGVLANT